MSRGCVARAAAGATLYRPGPYIGAIRWDAWFGPSALSVAGSAMETALGPDTWRYRLPFFGTEVNGTTVTVRGNAQATMDLEIGYARQAGLSYWAFDGYHPPEYTGTDYLTYGVHLFRASTNKQGLKYCITLHQLGAIADWTTLTVPAYVEMASESSYMKVLGNRPLFFALAPGFTDDTFAAAHVTTLRNACTAAGLGDPYIATMSAVPSVAATAVDTFGYDAISAYTWAASDTPGVATNRAYSSLVSHNATRRVDALATGKKVIPCVNEGWDFRPLTANPPIWDPFTANVYYTRGTAAEFANNLRDTVDWVRLNRSAAEAQAVLIYAWNEIGEGGWMTPPHPTHGSEGTTRLDELKTMLTNRRIQV
jgi:hypothetical protein